MGRAPAFPGQARCGGGLEPSVAAARGGGRPLTHNAVHQELQAVMARLRQLAQEGRREEVAGCLQQVLRRYGKDDEALMRLARFCQKQGWHGGFELFMTRLAARMPSSRAGILLTLGEHLLTAGRQRGFEHLRQAAAAALEHPDEEMLQRILRAAAQRLRERDDWEEAVEQFPPEIRGDLYLELAGLWGTAEPEKAWRAYRRGLRNKPDALPGEPLAAVAAAHARRVAGTEPDRASASRPWAAERVDDPKLVAQAAAIALRAGDKEQALRLSRQAARRLPEDLDNLGRLAALQAEAGEWGAVAALAPAIAVAVSRLNPWQREDHVATVELALEACLRTGQDAEARAVVEQVGLPRAW